MERVQTLVVGAGVVGLACARALARSGREVFIAEAAGAIGTGTSSRNSEVVHAGVYYPQGSRKARHCVKGAAKLYEYCKERGIAHRICGKLIVATNEAQRADLAKIVTAAGKNGVHLHPVTAEDVQAMEPEVSCVAALHSPRTGVVDSHGVMEALLADVENAGAVLALNTRVVPGGRILSNGDVLVQTKVTSSHGSESFQLCAREVINCSGLASAQVAMALGTPSQEVPVAHFCKGNYYALANTGSASTRPFSRLVYPVPEKNTSGLGVHATIDLAGQVRFGPDVEWLSSPLPCGRRVDEVAYDGNSASQVYGVDAKRSEAFYDEVRRYWPGLPDGSLVADYSGIRPKIAAAGEPAADFHVSSHSAGPGYEPSVVNLAGIESPGLTASLSLADEVLELLTPAHRSN